MAAQSDWAALLATGGYPADQWPQLVAILNGVRALWRAKEGDGSEPTDNLKYVDLGDSAQYNRFRLGYSASNFVIEQNTGTEGSPTWSARFTMVLASGNITTTGSLSVVGALTGVTSMTMGGALNMGGFNITNIGTITVGLISGVDITAHVARHLPGGADALTNNVAPPAIGVASAAGAGAALSNSSHTHEGLHQIDTDSSGAGQVKGDANLVSGGYMLVTHSGQDVTFAFAKPGRVSAKTVADQTGIAAEVNVAALTALALVPATSVDTRIYEISGTVEFVNGATAGADVTLRFYNGPAGNLTDGAGKKILEHTWDLATASGPSVLNFGPFPWTPTAGTDLKVGMTVALSGGTGTIKGTTGRISYMRVDEVFA